MMTRKDYRALASVLAAHHVDLGPCAACSIALDMVPVLQADNDRFDAGRFLWASAAHGMASPAREVTL